MNRRQFLLGANGDSIEFTQKLTIEYGQGPADPGVHRIYD